MKMERIMLNKGRIIMKRIIAGICVFLLFAVCALAEPAALTAAELASYARKMGGAAAITLTAGQKDPRGLSIGSSLSDVLNAYPTENTYLRGSYYDAALGVTGTKPQITCGWLLREGQRVSQITWETYAWASGGVQHAGITYTLAQDKVTGIALFGLDSAESLISEEQANEEINETKRMLTIQEYFSYPLSAAGDNPSFTREDLAISGLDLPSLTADGLFTLLGEADSDKWMQSSSTGAYRRVSQWDSGVGLVLDYSANRVYLHMNTLEIKLESLDGPRGVRIGDTLDSVLNRFAHGDIPESASSVILYGDGEIPPYGVLTRSESTTALTYTTTAGDYLYQWDLTFRQGLLESMLFTQK